VLGAALLVAGLDLRRRARDRSFLVAAVLGPLALAVIISTAFGDLRDGVDATIAVVDEDGSPASAGFVEALTAEVTADDDGADGGGLRFEAAGSAAAAAGAVEDGDAAAAVVVPAGFGDSLAGDRPLPLRVVADAEQRIGEAIATAVAEGFAAQVDAARLGVRTAIAADPGAADDLAALAARAAAVRLPVEVADAGFDGGFDPAAYFGPSMAILFLFLSVGQGARSLLVEQREGTLARVRTSPVPFAAVLLGKSGAVVATGLVTLLVMWGVTGLALGADWGDPVAVLVLIVASVLAVAGIGALVAGLARTDAQAEGWTAVVTFTLALLGGNFITPGALPDALRRLSLLTPNGWALRGFTELSAGRGDLADVLPAVAVLAATALVTGAAGVHLLARRLGA
jgi:ABC-2 type transport system permease protein